MLGVRVGTYSILLAPPFHALYAAFMDWLELSTPSRHVKLTRALCTVLAYILLYFPNSEWPSLNARVLQGTRTCDFDKIRLGEVLRVLTTHVVYDVDVHVVRP